MDLLYREFFFLIRPNGPDISSYKKGGKGGDEADRVRCCVRVCVLLLLLLSFVVRCCSDFQSIDC